MLDLIEELTDRDDKAAYARTKEIAAASESSPEYYSRIEDFASLLNDKKTYIRTRGFILCCSQARWDNEGYAADIYKRLGFTQTEEVREEGGIRYIPMVLER